MATTLRDAKLHEGALFHCYHVLESVASAGLCRSNPLSGVFRSQSRNRPGNLLPHQERIIRFGRAYQGAPFLHAWTRATLGLAGLVEQQPDRINELRNAALYYEERPSSEGEPRARFSQDDAEEAVKAVKQFLRQLPPNFP